eukprot:GGOE01058118.1.p2 GENE.GGOE01058118.1~~GGOE01058118.1.p2  ORF type:complete len:117 (+),score=7.22 GGOE01058118.1:323-673(+)
MLSLTLKCSHFQMLSLPNALTLPCACKKKSKTKHALIKFALRPYHTPGGYLWGPLVGRRAYKHHCAHDLVGDQYEWLCQVSAAEKLLAGHVPLLAEMAQQVLDVTRPVVGGAKPLR